MLPSDLPRDLPTFLARLGTDGQCRDYPIGALARGLSLRRMRVRPLPQAAGTAGVESARCGKQPSFVAGTIFEQTKTGFSRWFLAIWLVTSSKGGISAMELQRQMGFGSYQTAWSWLHKIRRAMVAPDRHPLAGRVEADATIDGRAVDPVPQGTASLGRGRRLGAAKPGRAGVPPARPRSPVRSRERSRQSAWPAARAAASGRGPRCPGAEPRGFSRPQLGQARDGGTRRLARLCRPRRPGLRARTDQAQPVLGRRGAPSVRHPPGLSLAKRWLLGTHHGAVRPKHLQAYFDEYVSRFNRRTASSIAHRFTRLVKHVVPTAPPPYRTIVHGPA